MGTYNFLDTDKIIESATGMKISEIFEKEGEDAFRDLECQVLDQVHAHVRCVVSTGGKIFFLLISLLFLTTYICVLSFENSYQRSCIYTSLFLV
jgi:shikimate kinase